MLKSWWHIKQLDHLLLAGPDRVTNMHKDFKKLNNFNIRKDVSINSHQKQIRKLSDYYI